MSSPRTALAIAALLLVGLDAQAQSSNVPETMDGYHFAEWLGTSHIANYTEWWYFNVYDSSKSVQAIFSYLVSNPANQPGGLLRLGIAEMAAVAYTPAGIVTEADVYPARAFSAAYDKACRSEAMEFRRSIRTPTRSREPPRMGASLGTLPTGALRPPGTPRNGSMWLPYPGN